MLEGEPEPVKCDTEVLLGNFTTVQVFDDLMSQWNVGMGGVVGLKYEAIPLVLKMHRIAAADEQDIFDGLRVMERAVVQQINKS